MEEELRKRWDIAQEYEKNAHSMHSSDLDG
ncbi:MAG: hypothetical protein UV51_C0007G0019 [Candidatus Woesebacteria bacterium GW2011_GWC1_42_9]|nr:MAG: hypothetical protein UV51_C0007G0019 [Candidatus Woesebacteria bacterium GW2011_GWC1_42_9]